VNTYVQRLKKELYKKHCDLLVNEDMTKDSKGNLLEPEILLATTKPQKPSWPATGAPWATQTFAAS
jgi:hypothetical protein